MKRKPGLRYVDPTGHTYQDFFNAVTAKIVNNIRSYFNNVEKNRDERDNLAATVKTNDAKRKAVANAQAALLIIGYDFGPKEVDGYKGAYTEKAIKDFQRAAGLPQTGNFDATTVATLNLLIDAGLTKEQIEVIGIVSGNYSTSTAMNDSVYGQPVTTREELEKLSPVDLVARTIYGEAGRGEYAEEAVARVIKNRKDSGKWGDNYASVVLARSQFCGLTKNEADPTKNPNSWSPNVNSDKWLRALAVAKDIVENNGANTDNPIGSAMYFRAASWLDERVKTDENGQTWFYDIDNKWYAIRDVIPFGGNKFFNYGKIGGK